MIEVNNLHKSFADNNTELHVLRGLHFSIQRGETVAIMGASGSGKTTLMQIMGGLDIPTEGQVSINGHRIDMLNERDITAFRNVELGYVFQFHHLLNDFTAVENAFLPGLIRGMKKKQARYRAEELLESIGVCNRSNHYPAELSGGEKQRVALARALFNKPAVVLADEPTGNLDRENTLQFLRLLDRLNRENNQTFVIATHDYDVAKEMDYCLFLSSGTIEKRGL
jgi:lipoprotein-releasing system ATP-binding protein